MMWWRLPCSHACMIRIRMRMRSRPRSLFLHSISHSAVDLRTRQNFPREVALEKLRRNHQIDFSIIKCLLRDQRGKHESVVWLNTLFLLIRQHRCENRASSMMVAWLFNIQGGELFWAHAQTVVYSFVSYYSTSNRETLVPFIRQKTGNHADFSALYISKPKIKVSRIC